MSNEGSTTDALKCVRGHLHEKEPNVAKELPPSPPTSPKPSSPSEADTDTDTSPKQHDDKLEPSTTASGTNTHSADAKQDDAPAPVPVHINEVAATAESVAGAALQISNDLSLADSGELKMIEADVKTVTTDIGTGKNAAPAIDSSHTTGIHDKDEGQNAPVDNADLRSDASAESEMAQENVNEREPLPVKQQPMSHEVSHVFPDADADAKTDNIVERNENKGDTVAGDDYDKSNKSDDNDNNDKPTISRIDPVEADRSSRNHNTNDANSQRLSTRSKRACDRVVNTIISPPRRPPTPESEADAETVADQLGAQLQTQMNAVAKLQIEYIETCRKTQLKATERLHHLEQKVAALEDEKKDLEIKVENQQTQITTLEGDRAGLVDDVEYLEKLVHDYEMSHKASEAAIREWEERCAKLTKVVGELGKVLAGVTTRLIETGKLLETTTATTTATTMIAV